LQKIEWSVGRRDNIIKKTKTDKFRYICYKKFIFLMKLFEKYAKINSVIHEDSSEGQKSSKLD
jgi:hypothetical protein